MMYKLFISFVDVIFWPLGVLGLPLSLIFFFLFSSISLMKSRKIRLKRFLLFCSVSFLYFGLSIWYPYTYFPPIFWGELILYVIIVFLCVKWLIIEIKNFKNENLKSRIFIIFSMFFFILTTSFVGWIFNNVMIVRYQKMRILY